MTHYTIRKSSPFRKLVGSLCFVAAVALPQIAMAGAQTGFIAPEGSDVLVYDQKEKAEIVNVMAGGKVQSGVAIPQAGGKDAHKGTMVRLKDGSIVHNANVVKPKAGKYEGVISPEAAATPSRPSSKSSFEEKNAQIPGWSPAPAQ